METKLKKVILEAKKLISPSRIESEKIKETCSIILEKVNSALKKNKINARLIIGGSIAKNTWLPGISDIDSFILFDYKTYSELSHKLSDIAERVIKRCFKNVIRVHGSRDYFIVKLDSITLEIVPVLEIKRSSAAKNITDSSPLHIYWLRRQMRKNPKLSDEIRLAKAFFKAQNVYGAESYIGGFSGHVIEILTCYYGGFIQLLKHVLELKPKEVIDFEQYYSSASEAIKNLNESKLSPLIIIDPVQSNRNAAAALTPIKLEMLKTACRKFLTNPNISFFFEKEVTLEKIPLRKDRKLIIIQAVADSGKTDIVGSKLFRKFSDLQKILKENGFEFESDWYWNKKDAALFWFYFNKTPLSATRIHFGPPLDAKKENIAGFRKKWGRIKQNKERYFVELKREIRRPEELLKNKIKNNKNFRIVKIAE